MWMWIDLKLYQCDLYVMLNYMWMRFVVVNVFCLMEMVVENVNMWIDVCVNVDVCIDIQDESGVYEICYFVNHVN